MKKPSLNLSKAGIKDFFFRHTEKLFFGLACGLILLFVWSGFKTPAYKSISPKQLLDKSVQANKFIHQDSHWAELAPHREADTAAADRIKNAVSVDPNAFAFRHLSGTAIFSREPRRDPAFLKPRDFEVQHFRAQFALAKDRATASGTPTAQLGGLTGLPTSALVMPSDQRNELFIYRPEKIKNKLTMTRDMVVGMALIDFEQQMKNYAENFQFQRGYDTIRDVPEFLAIEVERKTEGGEWQPITNKIYAVEGSVATPAKELAEDDYVLEGITLPIPPVLGIDYRPFSLLDEVPIKNAFEEKEKAKIKNPNKENDQSPGGIDPFGGTDPSTPADESDEKDASPMTMGDEESEKKAPVRLVRFFDMGEKEVGQTYFYRVRVWLKDPNNPAAVNAINVATTRSKGGPPKAGVGGGGGPTDAEGGGGGRGGGNKGKPKMKKPLNEQDLSREVRERLRNQPVAPKDVSDPELIEAFKLGIPTEWVECEQPVKVTAGFETFVTGPIKSPSVQRVQGVGTFALDEPVVTLVANSFQDDLGVFVPAVNKETMIGSTINFEAVANLLHPVTWEIKEVAGPKDKKGKKTGRRYITDAVLLDVMGGERQPFSRGQDVYYSPGEVLLMDRNGQIRVHNEMDEETMYRHSTFTSVENLEAMQEDKKKDKDDDDSGGDFDGGGGNNRR